MDVIGCINPRQGGWRRIQKLERGRSLPVADRADVVPMVVALLDDDAFRDRFAARAKAEVLYAGVIVRHRSCGVALAERGYPLNSLARPIPNRFVDRYVTNIRTQTGC